MKPVLAIVAAASILVSACGGQGDDALGEQAQEAGEARANALEEAADAAGGSTEDVLEGEADTVREAGEEREEAIDDADVDADALSSDQKEDLVKGQ